MGLLSAEPHSRRFASLCGGAAMRSICCTALLP
jgi:hypothetical protein